MAEGVQYVCTVCGKAIEAWSDGNPYYRDSRGKKRYAYHPNHDLLALCIGNDSPYLCLACGKEFMMDSEKPRSKCPKCRSAEIVDVRLLDGKVCPFCETGIFAVDPHSYRIS